MGLTKYYPVVDYIPGVKLQEQKNYRAKYAGVRRAPKRGEWYLSGSIVEAYRPPTT